MLLFVTGCSKPDSDVRAWRASDHDQEVEAVTPGPSAHSLTAPEVAPETKPVDALATWSSLCSGCHGGMGEGNGPMAAAIGARNLSDPGWQSTITDEQMAHSILNGKGRMPAFSLPPESVKGLVGLIRARKRGGKNGGAP